MTEGRPNEHRRGVTRGYVGGLIAASAAVAVALLIASWGAISYLTGDPPVHSPGVSIAAAEIIVFVALLLLGWGLWLQAIVLLRGRRTPPWAHTLVLALGAYFVWCLGGLLVGLGIEETWLSPYALALVIVWALSSIGFWGVLARRVYTDRPVPKWPWERDDDRGPDWNGPGSDGRDMNGSGDGDEPR